MRRRRSVNLAPPIGMSDHAPRAFGTDTKCRLNEIKCFLSNLLSVYTMYIQITYHLQLVSIPFYETQLTIPAYDRNLYLKLVRFMVPEFGSTFVSKSFHLHHKEFT